MVDILHFEGDELVVDNILLKSQRLSDEARGTITLFP
jgi:hypothetical protein